MEPQCTEERARISNSMHMVPKLNAFALVSNEQTDKIQRKEGMMTYQNEYVKHGNKTDAERSEMNYTNQK